MRISAVQGAEVIATHLFFIADDAGLDCCEGVFDEAFAQLWMLYRPLAEDLDEF
jgi:hypothetical protein